MEPFPWTRRTRFYSTYFMVPLKEEGLSLRPILILQPFIRFLRGRKYMEPNLWWTSIVMDIYFLCLWREVTRST